jgi:hypothetical protein
MADREYVFRPHRLWSARYTKDTSMKKRSTGRRRIASSIAVHSEFADAKGASTTAPPPVEHPAIPSTFGSALEEYEFLQKQCGIGPFDPNDEEATVRSERIQKLLPLARDEMAQAELDHANASSMPEDVELALELMSTLASGLRTFGFRQKASNALDALLRGNGSFCLLERLAIIHKGYWIEVYALANDIALDYFASNIHGNNVYSKEEQHEHARLLDAYVEEIRQSDAVVTGPLNTDRPAIEEIEPEPPAEEIRQSDAIVTGLPNADRPTVEEVEPVIPTDETRKSDRVVAATSKTDPSAIEGSEQQTPAEESRQPDPVVPPPASIDALMKSFKEETEVFSDNQWSDKVDRRTKAKAKEGRGRATKSFYFEGVGGIYYGDDRTYVIRGDEKLGYYSLSASHSERIGKKLATAFSLNRR